MQISPLSSPDRAEWERLARGYKAFYDTPTTDAEFDTTWHRLLASDQVFGLGAKVEGTLVGIAHYLFHASAWAAKVCYLQDLFTLPQARGQGVGKALIERVAEEARLAGAMRYYWLTQSSNATARGLYDKVAKNNGFIRYDFGLEA